MKLLLHALIRTTRSRAGSSLVRLHRQPASGKTIEARNKLDEGESAARNAIHQIDERLQVYRLKALQ
jgi:hypothetical protein